MANPITWRNVSSRRGAGSPASLLAGAQDSLNSGLDRLTGLIDRRQATQEANWDVRRDNNTQDFLNQLSQYQTPEAFEAARQSGALRGAMEGYGRQIDQGAARMALDERLGVLQQRNTATQGYRDDQTRRGNRGLRGRITDMVLDGDRAGAEALFDQNIDNFVDSDAVRRQLFGDLTSRNNETRAQAGERRSQAAEGRRATLFNQQQSDRTEAEELDDFLSGEYRQRNDILNQSREQFASAAEAYGLPIQSNGMPDLSGLDDRGRKEFSTYLAEQGVQRPPTRTELNQMLTDRLVEDMGLTPAAASTRVTEFDTALSNRGAQSQQDAARQERLLQDAERAYGIDSNPFAQASGDPLQAAADVVDKFTDDEGRLFGEGDPDERTAWMADASRMMSEGTVVNGQTYPVTPAVLEMAMQGVRGWTDNSIESQVQKIIKDGKLDRMYENYQDFSRESRAITAGALGETNTGTVRNLWDALRGG